MASTPAISSQSGRQDGSRKLPILDTVITHAFVKPTKRIHEGHDVPTFLTSQAYRDIGIWVMQLNLAMCPRKTQEIGEVHVWSLDEPINLPEPVQKLQTLLQDIESIVEEAPPDTGPRRFGNMSFRKWHTLLETRIHSLLEKCLPKVVLDLSSGVENNVSVMDELLPYLLGGFGSSQRLDYGTGHELSFLAFLGCIWKLRGFGERSGSDGALERSIVIGIIEPYFRVVRNLILTYTLEPAGSHGVWGLDDHSALPYIFGSAQCCPAITDEDPMPVEGSLPGAPDPGDIAKKNIVDKERKQNMYFSAVGFINDVKTGPFWEHSPMLFDISGVRTGWGKINKGMVKMYNGEVLLKFPVVQHFPFGSLFSWELDHSAATFPNSVHTASQPQSQNYYSVRPASDSIRASWPHSPSGDVGIPTTAPWANKEPVTILDGPTRAPWSQSASGRVGEANATPSVTAKSARSIDGPTQAPWATESGGVAARSTEEPLSKAPWADPRAHKFS